MSASVLHSGDSLMKRFHPNVQKEPKFCALSVKPISGLITSSRLCRYRNVFLTSTQRLTPIPNGLKQSDN
jgi:hypothetical protein